MNEPGNNMFMLTVSLLHGPIIIVQQSFDS